MLDYGFRDDTPDIETLIRLLMGKGYTYTQARALMEKYGTENIEWLLQGGN